MSCIRMRYCARPMFITITEEKEHFLAEDISEGLGTKDKARQGNTRHDTTRHDRTKRDKTRQPR
jgi:hypothetical protein